MTSGRGPLVFLLLALVTGCMEGGSPGKTLRIAAPAANVLPISVNGSLCTSGAYQNEPCVSVTVCSPATAECQTIDGILLDTGSSGLRIFRQALTVPLQQVASGSGVLAECSQYADGSADWGPVEMASLILGSEPAIEVPIQVIDYSFSTLTGSTPPDACSKAEQTPADAGFNGVLGVSTFTQDCGSQCATTISNGWYYTCGAASSGSGCTQTAVALSTQVPNPVALLPQDNNGVIVQLPAVPSGGVPSVSGSLVLGIGTRANNVVPAGVAAYSVDTYGEFTSVLDGKSYAAFLDTGSNGLFFPPPSSVSLPTCPCPSGTAQSQCALYSMWFCPPSSVGLTATNVGSTGTPSTSVTFHVANFDSFSTGLNSVFADIGGPSLPSAGFDWGLPFYFGLDVYVGVEGTKSSLGAGPYVAY